MSPELPVQEIDAFKLLLVRLDSDETEAVKKYQGLREKLVRHCFKFHEFLRADELPDEAFDVIAKKLSSSEQIHNIEAYAFKVLDNLLMSSRRRARPMTSLPENIPARDNPEHTVVYKMDGERKVECFLHCVNRLKPLERRLIFEYYPNESQGLEDRRRRIAAKLDIEPGTLMTRMNRLRTKIEQCCRACYQRASKG